MSDELRRRLEAVGLAEPSFSSWRLLHSLPPHTLESGSKASHPLFFSFFDFVLLLLVYVHTPCETKEGSGKLFRWNRVSTDSG